MTKTHFYFKGAVALLTAILSWPTVGPAETNLIDGNAAAVPAIAIQWPLDETLFPCDSAPAAFRWREPQTAVDGWNVTVQFLDGAKPLSQQTRHPEWIPSEPEWATIKLHSLNQTATVLITGVALAAPDRVRSQGSVRLRTSAEAVSAPLFYREVLLPFAEAVKQMDKIRWRFGAISSRQAPPVVLENQPNCGNCHSFSQDGRTLGMDTDLGAGRPRYILARTAGQMTLTTNDIINWNDCEPREGRPSFRGFLSQVSPDGRWVVSTVNNRTILVPKPDLYFSQLFLVVCGSLAIYDRNLRTFAALPGADDPDYVQTNPVWSPDGKYVVFARARSDRPGDPGRVPTRPPAAEEMAAYARGEKTIRYDLYRIPFNGGKGGRAEPLAGASGDGRSNYFPKYSPDGRWIVFCKAQNFMLLQPDSALYLIPAAGGPARRLRCNTDRMNSWHSWTPNSHWLVFSSKVNTPYTQLLLTHIDEQGESTPPILLDYLTEPDRAANIPEFVNLQPDGIQKISEQFLEAR